MTATAQFRSFGPFFLNGALVTAPHIFHYAAGTSTLKDAYADRGKLATVAQPLVGDANGLASAYWDGLYKLIVKTSDEATILATWDNVKISEHPDVTPSTWTPTLSCTTPGNLSLAYAYRQGEAYQVGGLCVVTCNLIVTPTFTTASGDVRITGSPYGYDGSAYPYAGALVATGRDPAASVQSAYLAAIDTANIMTFYKQQVGTSGVLQMSDLLSGTSCTIATVLVFQGA